MPSYTVNKKKEEQKQACEHTDFAIGTFTLHFQIFGEEAVKFL